MQCGTVNILANTAAGASVGNVQNIASGVTGIAYAAGDVIKLDFTAGGTTLLAGTIQVGDSNSVTGVTAANNGQLWAYSDGTDTYFAFNNASGVAGFAVAFRVTGADLITTTATNQAVVTTGNFGFTVTGTSTTGATITLL